MVVLVTAGTIEEAVLARASHKRALDAKVIQASPAPGPAAAATETSTTVRFDANRGKSFCPSRLAHRSTSRWSVKSAIYRQLGQVAA